MTDNNIDIAEIPNDEIKGFLEPYEEEQAEIDDILKEHFPELFE